MLGHWGWRNNQSFFPWGSWSLQKLVLQSEQVERPLDASACVKNLGQVLTRPDTVGCCWISVSDAWGCYFSAAALHQQLFFLPLCLIFFLQWIVVFPSCSPEPKAQFSLYFFSSPNPLRKPSSILPISKGHLFHQFVVQRWEQLLFSFTYHHFVRRKED